MSEGPEAASDDYESRSITSKSAVAFRFGLARISSIQNLHALASIERSMRRLAGRQLTGIAFRRRTLCLPIRFHFRQLKRS